MLNTAAIVMLIVWLLALVSPWHMHPAVWAPLFLALVLWGIDFLLRYKRHCARACISGYDHHCWHDSDKKGPLVVPHCRKETLRPFFVRQCCRCNKYSDDLYFADK